MQESIQILELPLSNRGEHPGFSVGDFLYDEGHALTGDGRKSFSISFLHRHPHFEIFWFRRGRGVIERDGERIEVGPSSMLILGPGDIHHWKQTEQLEGSLLCVAETFTSRSNFSLPFRELTTFLQPNGSRSIHLNPSENNLITHIFEIIRDAQTASNFDQREVLKALLLILFSKINGFYAGRGAPPPSPPLSPVTKDFKRALETECPRLASVKEFAEYLKVSRSYLHRAVLEDLGVSPSDLIRQRLVFEAKRLLRHTSGSSAEIAEHLGFRSASYFSRFFERHAQVSPRAFRSGG